MDILPADIKDLKEISKLDSNIPLDRLEESINNRNVFVLKDGRFIVGMLRYSLFWQTIPFLDLLYIYRNYRGKGYGSQMMAYWEEYMRALGYEYAMTSTQSDETAYRFYERLGYKKCGTFRPPLQKASEWMYKKGL